MKRSVSFGVMIVMILNICMSACALDCSVSLNAPDSVESGRSFKAVAAFNGDTLVCAADINVSYDSDLHFGGAKLLTDGRIKTSEENGSVKIICMSPDGFPNGDIIELSFTSEKGYTGTASISIDVVQAVDANENSITPGSCKADIVIGNGDRSTAEKTGSAARNEKRSSSSSRSKSSSSSKRSASSKSTVSASSKRKRSSSSTGNKSSKAQSHTSFETHDRAVVGRVDREDNKMKYAAAGALGAMSLVGIAFVFYRLGASGRKE